LSVSLIPNSLARRFNLSSKGSGEVPPENLFLGFIGGIVKLYILNKKIVNKKIVNKKIVNKKIVNKKIENVSFKKNKAFKAHLYLIM